MPTLHTYMKWRCVDLQSCILVTEKGKNKSTKIKLICKIPHKGIILCSVRKMLKFHALERCYHVDIAKLTKPGKEVNFW